MKQAMIHIRCFALCMIILLLPGSCINVNSEKLPEVPDIAYIEDVITGNKQESMWCGEHTIQWTRTKLVPWAEVLDPDYLHAPEAAVERFRDMKIGIRIHWGVYCLNGSNPSWSLWYKKGQLQGKDRYPESSGLSNEDYVDYIKRYSTFYQDFNPQAYDPAEWARLFKNAGLRFAVLTAKHHDGFSMFNTATEVNALRRKTDSDGDPGFEKVRHHYSIMETDYKKDIVGAYCNEMRKAGLGVGLYFSNPDWNDYDFRFGQHNIFRDTAYTRESDPRGWTRALMRHRTQLIELCSNYGPIDVLSFDHGLPMDAWPEFKGTLKMIRKLQPDMMIRRRGIGAYGDHFTPEGKRPVFPGDQDRDVEKDFHRYPAGKPWSKIGGTGSHPAYDPDLRKIDTRDVVHQLIEICSMGGVMQLGFGPDPDGRFHPNVSVLFDELGAWLKINGDGIYFTRPYERKVSSNVEGIYFTRSKDYKMLNVFVSEWPVDSLRIEKIIPVPGSEIILAGYGEALQWEVVEGSVLIQIPQELPCIDNCPEGIARLIRVELAEDHFVQTN